MKVWLPAVRAGSGSDVFVLRLASALSRHGVSVHINWFSRYEELWPRGASISRVPAGIDVIHANSWHASKLIGCNAPLLLTAHTDSDASTFDQFKPLTTRYYHRALLKPRIQKAVEGARCVAAVSSRVASHYLATYGAHKIEVVPNWLPQEMYPFCARESSKPKQPKLLYAGRQGWHKGSDHLPAIARGIARYSARLACTIDRKHWPEVEVPQNVEFLGLLTQAELVREMIASTAIIMPSRSEGFGLVALEAMACGTPVIGFSGTGLDDLIQNSIDGLLVPQGNVDGLVRAFEELLSGDCWGSLSHAAQLKVTTEFREEKVISKYLDLYRHV